MRTPPFGTAHAEVLLRITSGDYGESWSLLDGTALYESRAHTDTLCQGLVRQGFLHETLQGTTPLYTVTTAGRRKAKELREYRGYF
jgi:hypothetical protein